MFTTDFGGLVDPRDLLRTGRDAKSPTWIDAHADGLVSILLPGLAGL